MKSEYKANQLAKEMERWENSNPDDDFKTWQMNGYVGQRIQDFAVAVVFTIVGVCISFVLTSKFL